MFGYMSCNSKCDINSFHTSIILLHICVHVTP
jgi:hypothetical protein